MTWCERFGWFETYDRLEQTWIGEQIRQSLWLFPGIEAIHLLGLALLGGAVLVVDLRLLGLGLTRMTTPDVLRAARPWFIGALVLMFATGGPLFLSEAVKCCFNDSFEVKIAALLLGIIFTFAVRDRIALQNRPSTWVSRLVAVISLAIWLTVAAAGRWIGFSG